MQPHETQVSINCSRRPFSGSRHWNDLSQDEQDKFLMSCFKGEEKREAFCEQLDLYSHLAFSITYALLGDEFLDKTPADTQEELHILLYRAQKLEHSLLGIRLGMASLRERKREEGVELCSDDKLDLPLRFDKLVNSARDGDEHLSEECTAPYYDAEASEAFDSPVDRPMTVSQMIELEALKTEFLQEAKFLAGVEPANPAGPKFDFLPNPKPQWMKISPNEWGGVAAFATMGAAGFVSDGVPFFEAIGGAVCFTLVMVAIVVVVDFFRRTSSRR